MLLRIYPPTPVSVQIPPVSYIDNGLITEVEDNKGLPTKLMIYKNGVQVPLASDDDPNEVVAMPVQIVGVDGTDINITAGDINIQSTSEGANFDSIRIGDGSGEYLKIESDGSINANVDNDSVVTAIGEVKTELETLNLVEFATETTLGGVKTELETLNSVDFATETTLGALSLKVDALATIEKQDELIAAIEAITFDKTGLATSAKQDTELLKLTEMDLELENQTSKLGDIDTKLTSTNTKLTEMDNAVDAMSAKLPSSLGAKTKALSLSITPATDSGLATEAKQDAGIAELTAIKNSVSAATFIPKTYDEVVLTYNGAGDIGTVTYKLASATIATLTLTYTNGNLTGVVKS